VCGNLHTGFASTEPKWAGPTGYNPC
jgi:hypothetical protein